MNRLFLGTGAGVLSLALLGIGLGTSAARGATADQPEAWLVLYNINSADSCAWVDFYQQAHDIPSENILGLNCPLDEHLWTWDDYHGTPGVESLIVGPVRDYLDDLPHVKDRVVGIVLGYDLPNHYWYVPAGGEGGLSVANALQDLDDNSYGNNPHCAGNLNELPPPLTRDQMHDNQYMVCQMDAPDLGTSIRMTLHALALGSQHFSLSGQYVDYDYNDTTLPQNYWPALSDARHEPQLADLPWREFDSDTSSGEPDVALRFGTHRINWSVGAFDGVPPGAQILAYNLNSFGAVSVRDADAIVWQPGAVDGPYVPNALLAGYAAAIGSTGEPYCCLAPYPEVLLRALGAGRTLGEAFYLSNPSDDWTWTCVGDPLLRVENWFGESVEPIDLGDTNCDGVEDLYDIAAFVLARDKPELYVALYPGCSAFARGDANCDGWIDAYDISAFVIAMLSPAQYEMWFPSCSIENADMNMDEVIDTYDVDAFLAGLAPVHGD